MIAQGFFADHAALSSYVSLLNQLAKSPGDAGLAWQLGIDEDIIDDGRRRAEIINWIESCVITRLP